jgi:hypothetical protein
MKYLKDYYKCLKSIYKKSHSIKHGELDGDTKKKLETIIPLFKSTDECVRHILKLCKKDQSLLVPILARTVIENSINIAILALETIDNGANRYLLYNEVENYKIYKKVA